MLQWAGVGLDRAGVGESGAVVAEFAQAPGADELPEAGELVMIA